MRRRFFTSLVLLATFGFASGAKAQKAADLSREPLFLSLWRDSEESARYANETLGGQALEEYLSRTLRRALAGTAFSSIRVEFTGGYDKAVRALESGRFSFFECDPGLMFSNLSGGAVSIQESYAPILQRMPSTSEQTFGSILTLKESGIRTIQDLKGKTIAAVNPFAAAGSIVQNDYLKASGLNPAKDFDIHYSQSPSEAVKMLVSRWADAAFVPQGSEREAWTNALVADTVSSHLVQLAVVGPVPGNVFLVNRKILEEVPRLKDDLSEALISHYGATALVPTKQEYYITLRDRISNLFE